MKCENRQLPSPRFLAAFLFYSLGLVIAWEGQPLEDAGKRFVRFKAGSSEYSSYSLPLTSMDEGIFVNARTLKQAISWRGQRFLLMAIDGTHNRHAVHDPLYCFRGAGWEVKAQQMLPLCGETALWLHLRRPVNRQSELEYAESEAVYFFSTGERRYVEPKRYWGEATLRRLTLGRSGQEPVLFVLQPLSPSRKNMPDWQRILMDFRPLSDL